MHEQKNPVEIIHPILSKAITNHHTICGYASVFDVKDYHDDMILSGAFKNSINAFKSGKIIPLLWQHAADKPIGVVTDLIEDEYGLYIKASILSTTQCGREAYELIKSKAICGFSIGYRAKADYIDSERAVRVLKEIDLWEISVVTFPANRQTCITQVI